MVSNRFVLAGVAVACVAAAGAGGYLANRQAPSAVVSAEPAAEATPESAPVAAPAMAVQETEGVVGGPTSRSVAAAPPAVPLRDSKPATSSPRPSPRRTAERTTPAAALPPLERTWPSSQASQSVALPPVAEMPTAPIAEPVVPAPPPAPAFVELTVDAESVVGLQLESTITSERARVEDRVEARVVRDVRADGQVAIPAGSRAQGSVVLVERGGRFKERARLGIRFHTLVLGDGTQLPISTETIYRYGDAPSNGTAAKIGGGAVAGAILGAIIGGSKGAAIGATAGAGGGTAAVMAGDRSAASFASGSEVTARLIAPVIVTVDR